MTDRKCARTEEYNPFQKRQIRGREPGTGQIYASRLLILHCGGRVREDRWAYIRLGTGVRGRDRERMDIRMSMNAGGEAEGR